MNITPHFTIFKKPYCSEVVDISCLYSLNIFSPFVTSTFLWNTTPLLLSLHLVGDPLPKAAQTISSEFKNIHTLNKQI